MSETQEPEPGSRGFLRHAMKAYNIESAVIAEHCESQHAWVIYDGEQLDEVHVRESLRQYAPANVGLTVIHADALVKKNETLASGLRGALDLVEEAHRLNKQAWLFTLVAVAWAIIATLVRP